MKIKVAINGFGRIGRSTFKAAFGRLPELEFVAINDLTAPATLAHLLRHDSSYGMYDKIVIAGEKDLTVDGHKILVTAEKDPAKLPWKDLDIDVVLECTGRFTDEKGAGLHLTAGAKRVIISAPAKGGNVPTHVLGVNGDMYDGAATVINNASCTTNCISPVTSVLHERFGILRALMSTVHGYTADQNLQDGPHGDLRRARAAAINIVPTTTGAAIATTEAIPELKGMFDGIAIRVPVPVVSLSDLTYLFNKKTSVEEVNSVLKEASEGPLKGILGYTEEELVSTDFIKNPHSCIVDAGLTKVIGGDFVKVVAWYDNEWGYSMRLGEMAVHVGKTVRK